MKKFFSRFFHLFSRLFSRRKIQPSFPYDQVLLVFSDVEMGAGGVLDDFPQSDALGQLITQYNLEIRKHLQIDLVFNGDTFDFLKTSVEGEYPYHIDCAIALAKARRIARHHMEFFRSIQRFVEFNPEKRRVFFIVGNHDAEILFPEVQQYLRELTQVPHHIFFPGFSLSLGDVHIEHGSQHDPLFRMNPDQLFIKHQGRTLLNHPWGVVPLLEVVMPMQKHLYHLDRLKPRKRVFELLPEAKDLFTSKFWDYWTKDRLKNYFKSTDPFKKITWSMLKEVIRRFSFTDPEVSTGNYFHQQLLKDDKVRLYLVGHLHDANWFSHGDRKIIHTGCFRNEFMLSTDGKNIEPIAKSMAKVYMNKGKVTSSKLTELPCPPVPENYIPFRSIYDFRPILQQLVGSTEELEKTKDQIKSQEQKDSIDDEARAS